MNYNDKPTAEFIVQFVNKYEAENPYDKWAFQSSYDLVKKKYPDNKTFDDVFVKAVYINGAFKTRIGNIDGVAKGVYEKLIKDKPGYLHKMIHNGDANIVHEIARSYTTKDGDVRNNYSFATKYCHCHNPEAFPIYDGLVDDRLWHYKALFSNEATFPKFNRNELRNYTRFRDIFTQFKVFANSEHLENKIIDRFLWGMVKKLRKGENL